MRSRKTIATPPGATLKEQLNDRGMTQKEFALRMDMSEKHISKLINGEVKLTPDVALRLESVLGIPAQFWNNLEARFQEKIARVQEENAMDADQCLLKKLPYIEMSKYNWVEDTKDSIQRVMNLRRFFGIAKLDVLDNLRIPGIAYRRTAVGEKSDYVLAVWAQQARIEAKDIEVSQINIQLLIEQLPSIRSMTIEAPEAFCPKLKDQLAKCGIALVFLPHMGGSFLHGASFYDGKKIVMGLTVRGHDADRFWFSLFHEISHIIEGHIGKESGPDDSDERNADQFARDQLIPPEMYQSFIQSGRFNKESILIFAQQVAIDPGIVVGRLQKENRIDYSWHNDLKTKYIIR